MVFIKHFLKTGIQLFFLLLASKVVMAQSPVLVTAAVMPPYSTLLSEYYSGDGQRVSITLLNRDPGQPFLQGYLRVRIEGQGVKLQSNIFGNYPALDLTYGSPLLLNGTDLAPYFTPQNLSGTTGQGFQQQNRLPEGFYSFCFEVLEKNTNRIIGASQCAQAYLQLNDPPFLLLPEKGKPIAYTNPFNLLFQWSPRHLNIANTEYQFDLVEIWDTTITPEAAFYTAKPVYSTNVYTPNLFYGPGEPQLLIGKKYAWRVKAKVTTSTNEQEPFKNDGYSEVFWFKLQGECMALQKATIVSDPVTNKTTLSWTPDVMNIGPTTLEYRKKGSNNWLSKEAPQHQVTLTGLAWDTEYEYKLGNRCVITDDYAYGSLQNFKTLTQDTANCVPSAPQPLSNQNPIAMLRAGDTIYASGFRMRLTQVAGANGVFSGQGYLALMIPTTTTEVSVRAAFTNISINTDKQVVAGNIVSLYDKTGKGIVDLDPITEGGIGVGEVKTGGTSIDATVNVPVDPTVNAGVVVSGTIPDTTYTVTLTSIDGKPVTITTKKLPVVVQDSKGDIYSIDKTGKVTPIGKASGQLLAGKTPEVLDKLNSDKGKVTFNNHPDEVYAFDGYDKTFDQSMLFSQQYQSLNNGEYRVGNKLLVTGSSDKVIAKVSKLKKGWKADSLHFITGKGVELLSAKKDDDSYEITLLSGPAGDAQELYAIYRDNEGFKANTNANLTSKDFTYSLGKLKIATYQPKQLSVTLIPVGSTSVNEQQISKRLNDIYNPVGITWTVSTGPVFTQTDWDSDNDGKLDITGAGKYNQYSTEMKALNLSYIQNNSIDPSKPYLFVFDNSPKAGTEEKGRGVLGDMLRNKQFGYLFLPGNNDPGQVTAHELGHGVFHLSHTFDTQYKLQVGDLDSNLMDYSGGDQLVKLQWDAIHAPGLVIGVFEKEGDGAFHEGKFVCIDNALKQRLMGKQNYFAPNGKKISLGTAIPIAFYKGDSKALDGSVHSYERNGIKYIASTLHDEFNSYQSDKSVADAIQYVTTGDAVKIIFDADNNYSFGGQQYFNSGCDATYANCKTQASKSYKTNFIYNYKSGTDIAKAIDEIVEEIDKDPGAFEDMMAIVETGKKLYSNSLLIKKYSYYNETFTITSSEGSLLEYYQNFKQSLITYKQRKQNIINLANEISCEPKEGETSDAYKGRIYFCTAILTADQASSLSLATRNNILCALSRLSLDGIRLIPSNQLISAEGKENVVLLLLRTTPEADKKEVLKGLIKPYLNNSSRSPLGELVSRMDGENYGDFILILTNWILNKYPAEQGSWQQILQRKDRKQRNILALGNDTDGYTADFNLSDNGAGIYIEITENLSFPIRTHKLPGVSPYDYVVVKFTENYTFLDRNFRTGEVYVLPGLLVYAIMHNMQVNTWKTTAKYTLYAALLTVGVGEIMAANTTVEMSIALADMAIASNDIVVNEVLADQLKQTADGRLFLDRWNKFALLYGGTRAVSELTGLSKELNALAKKINKKETDDIVAEINKKVGLTERFVARSAPELEQYLATIVNKPIGKSYSGDLYRSLSKSSEIQYSATPNKMTSHEVWSSWGRYDLDGEENAMYLSKTLIGNETELVPHYGEWSIFNTYKFSNVQISNLLDLTDDVVLQKIGVQFPDLVRVIESSKNNINKAQSYELTNVLSSWARKNGYNGIIATGARGMKDYENIILFDQNYIDLVLKNKIAEKLNK